MPRILDFGLMPLGLQGEIQDLNNRVTNVENEIQEMREKGVKVFGVRRLLSSTNPEWERVYDSVGMVANATKNGSNVRNDFDSQYPFCDFISYNYDNTDKKITAYLGETGFTFDGSNGDVLTLIPKTYNLRYIKDGYEYRLTATGKIHNFKEYEQRSAGRYVMSGTADLVSSKNGVAPLVNKTRANFRSYATAKGSEWSQLDFETYAILQHLFIIEYATYNSQDALGQGVILSSNTAAVNSGGCDSLGMKSGCVANDGKHSVIYRGIEDIFGNVWQFIDGLNINEYVGYICKSKDHAQFADNVFIAPYKKLSYNNLSTNDVYPKNIGCDPDNDLFGLPTETGGSSNTGITDKYWCNPGQRIARVGGGWNDGAGAGLFFWALGGAASVVYASVGARLLRHHE